MAEVPPKQAIVASRTQNVKELLAESLAKVQEAVDEDAGHRLFPGGITKIEIVVGVANVQLKLLVSGPDKQPEDAPEGDSA